MPGLMTLFIYLFTHLFILYYFLQMRPVQALLSLPMPWSSDKSKFSFKGRMSRGYRFFRSILCWSHYLVSFFIYKILSYIYQEDIKQLISILNFELFPLKVKTFLVKWFSYFNLHFVSVTVYLPKYIHVLNSCSWYDLWFKVAF